MPEQNSLSLQVVRQNIQILNLIYDTVRIIDPLKKRVVELDKDNLNISPFHCYEFWAHKKICKNCISMRAFQQKDTFFKLEYSEGRIYMITALPLYSNEDTLVLELFKDVTNSMAIENMEESNSNLILKTLSNINDLQIKDGLTSLLNRRFIDERLPVDILNSQTDNKPLSIVMADLDRFKMVNDSYGHIAGDFILKEFSSMLKKCLEGKDCWVARYGGEEFLLCLLDTGTDKAADTAESIRKKLESTELKYNEYSIKVTSSFGVITLTSKIDISKESLIDMADKNLYKAKSEGRNRVISSTV